MQARGAVVGLAGEAFIGVVGVGFGGVGYGAKRLIFKERGVFAGFVCDYV